jgi:hypothetical protein
MEPAFDLAATSGLDVRIVCRNAPGEAMAALAGRFGT